MKKIPLLILFFCVGKSLLAQTGPGGVGTSTNNAFWVKADQGTSSSTNNAPISAWNDQSGNAINMSQTVAAQQPSFVTNYLNGFPSVLFDNVTSTNDKMAGPDSPLLDSTEAYSFFTVTTRVTSDGEARAIVSKRTDVGVQNSFMIWYGGNYVYVDIDANNDRFASLSSSYFAGNSYLNCVIYDGTLLSTVRTQLYNGETFDRSAQETSTLVPNYASPIVLGSPATWDARPFGGAIAEVIIYRTALVPAQRSIVNNYLSAKYNLALSANDKYAGDNTANGDYDREVAGIGKESTGSNDSFSTSISGGMGITAVSGLDNSDYVLAGHATATNAIEIFDVAGMSGTNNGRWLRNWYIDITNTSTQITANITFGAADAGMGAATLGTTLSDYVLLYRAGLSGSWTELASASSVVGDKAIFNSVTLSNDGYYTLGSRNYTTSILPIELMSFEAKADEEKVHLKWSTATEKNNESFTVEKATDGENFSTVAIVKGAGNSSARKDYYVADPSPYKGLSYYRLKQSDFDGKFNYSKIIAVEFLKEEDGLKIYPNPSSGSVTIEFLEQFVSQSTRVSLKNVYGKQVKFNQLISKNQIKLDLSELPAGVYLVGITIGKRTIERKIALQK